MNEKMKNEKWVYILLSCLLAFVFWYYVRVGEDPKQDITVRNVPVHLVGENVLSNQGFTISSISNETVELVLNANYSQRNLLTARTVSISLDVSKCAGAGEYELSYTVNLPATVSSVTVENRSPQKIKVTVDRLYSKTLDIGFELHGSVAQGYQIGQAVISPETVIISGAADEVSQISRAVVRLERTNLSERFSGDLPIVFLDGQGNVLTGLDISLSTATAYTTLPVVVIREIPLSVKLIDGGGATIENVDLIIQPKTITVSGSEKDMAVLDEISLGTINLSDITSDECTFTMPISPDVAFENVSGIAQASVTVRINGLETRLFDVDTIEFTNIPNNYHVSSIASVVAIRARGAKESLDKISADQFRIVADLSEITATGTISVPVSVYLNGADGVGIVGKYSIVVQISK